MKGRESRVANLEEGERNEEGKGQRRKGRVGGRDKRVVAVVDERRKEKGEQERRKGVHRTEEKHKYDKSKCYGGKNLKKQRRGRDRSIDGRGGRKRNRRNEKKQSEEGRHVKNGKQKPRDVNVGGRRGRKQCEE